MPAVYFWVKYDTGGETRSLDLSSYGAKEIDIAIPALL